MARDRSLDGPNHFKAHEQIACAGFLLIIFAVVLVTVIVRTM